MTAGGESELVLTVPFRKASICDVTPDGNRVVAQVTEAQSDLWLIEDFDPEIS